jgi:hypothetical protein
METDERLSVVPLPKKMVKKTEGQKKGTKNKCQMQST